MKMTTLEDLFLYQLRDLYSAAQQIANTLPVFIAHLPDSKVSHLAHQHLQETNHYLYRLEQCFTLMNAPTSPQICKPMDCLLQEAKELAHVDADSVLKEAGLISFLQRICHYNIAAYGTAGTYAKYLGHVEVLQLLKETLAEEKRRDGYYSQLAESLIKPRVERKW